jgi:hypothetical protein
LLGQRTIIGMGMAGVLILSGCYGSTEPATDIGPESAKLNARGTANNGPAHGGFEYWLTNATASANARRKPSPQVPAAPSPSG